MIGEAAPPADGVLVSYADGSTEGVRIPASLSTTRGVTTAFAEVDHFTVFRWETDQGQAEAGGDEQAAENRIKPWTIQVNDKTPMPDESGTWTSNWTLNMFASTPYDNILGPYNGTAKLGLKGTANLGPALSGSMSGSWSGPVHFDKGVGSACSVRHRAVPLPVQVTFGGQAWTLSPTPHFARTSPVRWTACARTTPPLS
jgi:hypothetical protein